MEDRIKTLEANVLNVSKSLDRTLSVIRAILLLTIIGTGINGTFTLYNIYVTTGQLSGFAALIIGVILFLLIIIYLILGDAKDQINLSRNQNSTLSRSKGAGVFGFALLIIGIISYLVYYFTINGLL